ncbi:inositol monophosphatase family protein [Lactococcus laudensis]|uniref:Inositol monophosphatase family protein n=1 Tax=Pseudolactococcus laudensis TaxID=1494461 RepID=A0A7V8SJU8_9LACT|nr:inositol monophosphatase family protein [Lactococcus laudensis]MBA0016708.1 inositol monophosphatase family protein [Lactococcus laudensis]MBW9281412.1 inositol monophosphatase family protein [Lactococcus laudensis]
MLNTKLEFAKKVVRQAGGFIRQHLSDDLEISEKTHFDDLVTNLDREVQEQILTQILSTFPKDHVLAEENDVRHDIKDGNVWVLDPIDGTTNFIVQRDNFAVMLAYYESGIGKIGVILDVMSDNLYWGDGTSAYKNEAQIHLTVKPLRQSLIGVNTYMYRTNAGGLLDLSHESLGVRAIGSAGIEYVNILEGKIWGYFSNLSPWDYAAGAVLIAPFGYITQQIDGRPLAFEGRQMMMSVPSNQLDKIKAYIK